MAKINKSTIDGWRKAQGANEAYLWDDELKGFGVRLYPSGAARFILKYRTSAGAQRKYSIGRIGIVTAEQARDLAKIALGKLASGEDPSAASKADKSRRMTVRELCGQYLEAAQNGLITGRRGTAKKQSTLYTDKGRIDRHILPQLGDRLVREVSRADIEGFKAAVVTGKTAIDIKTGLRGRARVTGGKGTATRTLGLLGGIFTWAVANGHAETNPVQGVRRFASRERKSLLSPAQYRLLGDIIRDMAECWHPNGKPVHSATGLECILFLALTGLRKGEAESLTWDQVSFDDRCLRLDDTKTGASVRPIGHCAWRLLCLRRERSTGRYVFPSPASADLPYRGLPGLWRTLKAKAATSSATCNLDGITLHSLRHSFAGMADELGATLPTIATLLGQRLGGVTNGYILKRIDAPLLATTDQVAGAIAGCMSSAPVELLTAARGLGVMSPKRRKAR